MKRASKFALPPTWKVMLHDMQIDPVAVLAHAALPQDLFQRPNATLSPAEYFQLWYGIEQAAGDRKVPLLLAEHLRAESFDAPIFAAICSPNLHAAVKRLRQYKPLIGPMEMVLSSCTQTLSITIECYGYNEKLPRYLGLSELVFFTQLARIATREHIKPLKVTLPNPPQSPKPYEDYFGCELSNSNQCTLTFSQEDAQRPFLTQNAAMWAFFEDKLNKKLNDLNSQANVADRVRAALLEALPSGESSVEHIAQKLAMSKRALQRKLSAEQFSFQAILQSVRAELADHYLLKSSLSLSEISFLLGFQETNSFIRAYSVWRGYPPGSQRSINH